VLLVMVAVLLPLGGARAQNANGKFDVTEAGRQLDKISRDLDLRRHDRDQLKDWAQQVQSTKRNAGECATATQQNLDKANKDLETLGAPIKGEPADVAQQRRALKRQISDDEKRLASCKLLVLRSDDIASRISAVQQQIIAARLLATGPTVVELVQDYWQQPGVWYAAGRTAFLKNTGLQLLSTRHLLTLAVLVAVGLAIGIWLRKRIGARLCRHREEGGATAPTLFGRIGMCLLTLFAHYLPYFLVTSLAAVYFYIITGGLAHAPLISVIAYGLPVYFLLIAAIRFFLDPFPPAAPLHSLPTDVARSLGRRLRVLVLLIFLAYLLFSTLLTQGLPETAVELLRAIIGAVFILNLIWIVWLSGRIPRLAHTLGLRSGLILVLAASMVAEWLGYRNFSLYLLRAVLGTIVALGITLLLTRLARELFDVIDSTRHPWQQWLHQRLGLKPGQKIPGLIWLRLVAFILLWGGFILATLRIWWHWPIRASRWARCASYRPRSCSAWSA
jgi:potassium efflux system protein